MARELKDLGVSWYHHISWLCSEGGNLHPQMLAFFTRLLGDPSFSLLLPRSTLVVRLREGGFQYPLGTFLAWIRVKLPC